MLPTISVPDAPEAVPGSMLSLLSHWPQVNVPPRRDWPAAAGAGAVVGLAAAAVVGVAAATAGAGAVVGWATTAVATWAAGLVGAVDVGDAGAAGVHAAATPTPAPRPSRRRT